MNIVVRELGRPQMPSSEMGTLHPFLYWLVDASAWRVPMVCMWLWRRRFRSVEWSRYS